MSQLEDLVKALKDLGGKPEEVPTEVKELMKSLLKEEPDVKPETRTTRETSYVNPPRLPSFSGRDPPGSGETSYDLWHYEVLCLVTDKVHSHDAILQAIRRSVRGDAGKVLMRLGPQTNLGRVVEKMDSVFGVVEEKESVMREFYNATQGDNEDVSAWSFRLEDILEKAIQTGKVERRTADSMLHDMLWKGLNSNLKAMTHYEKEKYDTFDTLRVALRRVEKDNNLDRPTKTARGTSKKAVAKKTDDVDDEDDDVNLKGMMKAVQGINTRLDTLEVGMQQHQYGQYNNYNRGRGFRRGYRGGRYSRGYDRGRYQGRYQDRYQGGNSRYQDGYQGGTNRYQGGTGRYQDGYQRDTSSAQEDTQSTQQQESNTCRKCGQEGHLAKGCLNRPNQYRNLNAKVSTSRGKK